MYNYIKRQKYFLLIGLFYLLTVISPGKSYSQSNSKHFFFGFDGGLTYNGLTGDVPEDASYKRKIGYIAGVHFDYKINQEITLGVGSRYYNTGTIVTYDVGEKETIDSFDISVNYISFPLTLKVTTGKKASHFVFTSGFDYRYLLNAKMKYLENNTPDKDVKEKVQSYDFSIFMGVGGIISFGRPSVGLELRYSYSLNNISKDNFSISSGLPARFRFAGFQLLVLFDYSL